MPEGFLSGLRSRAAEDGQRAALRLRHDGEDARDELRQLWGQLEDLMERRLAAGGRQAGQYVRQGREATVELAEHLGEAARQRPLLAAGIGLGALALLGALLFRRR